MVSETASKEVGTVVQVGLVTDVTSVETGSGWVQTSLMPVTGLAEEVFGRSAYFPEVLMQLQQQ